MVRGSIKLHVLVLQILNYWLNFFVKPKTTAECKTFPRAYENRKLHQPMTRIGKIIPFDVYELGSFGVVALGGGSLHPCCSVVNNRLALLL
jgi:hypothetical protein